MNKNLLYWIIAIVLGSLIFFISNAGLIQFVTSSKLEHLSPWILILVFALLFSYCVGMHLLLIGQFIKRLYFSIWIIILVVLSFIFRTLHWEGGYILSIISSTIIIVFASIHILLKKPKSQLDIPLLLFVISWKTLSIFWLFRLLPYETIVNYWKTPTLGLMFIISIVHVRNQVKKIKS